MTSSPLISIVLPTYNGARYLAQSIQSCLDQTYTNWELIIVDDASTDETPQIIAHFTASDPRIRSVRHETNRKLPNALNTGFAESRGEFLTWTSDDNYYLPHALETMANFLLSNLDVGLVYSDYTLVEESKEDRKIRVKEPEALPFSTIVGPCFLYRRKVYETIGNYNSDAFLSEDYDYWLRVSSKFLMESLHENLYYYRAHVNSLTESRRNDAQISVYETRKRNFPNLLWLRQNRRLSVKAYTRLAWDARALNRPLEFYKFLLKAFFVSPMNFIYIYYRIGIIL